MVTLHTNKGDISLELDFDKAPESARNFLEYCESGFYDGTIFHRVIDGFMIQGGGMTPEMRQKETREPIRNEANNGLKNEAGTVAMARTMDPHSATAQFFINVSDNDFLNFRREDVQGWGYAVFGRVVEGMDVVDAIREVSTGSFGPHQDVPREPIIIEAVSVADCVRTPDGFRNERAAGGRSRPPRPRSASWPAPSPPKSGGVSMHPGRRTAG